MLDHQDVNSVAAGLVCFILHVGLHRKRSQKIPQRWFSANYHHSDSVYGYRYKSRHLNDSMASVVFDRAAHKLQMTASTLPQPSRP